MTDRTVELTKMQRRVEQIKINNQYDFSCLQNINENMAVPRKFIQIHFFVL